MVPPCFAGDALHAAPHSGGKRVFEIGERGRGKGGCMGGTIYEKISAKDSNRNSCSRIFVTAVILCALVNGGQHLFFLCECWMVFFFFLSAVGRELLQRFRNGSPFFLTP